MLIEARDIHKSYIDGRKIIEVLKGIRLGLAENDFIALVGPSGAGKSTLLHILGGLDTPTRGSVLFEGRDLYAQQEAALAGIRNRKIGFIFQFYHLLPEFTVLENALMPALIGGTPAAQVRERARELLERVGLRERLAHFPSQLSGGEQQRVAIVRALINRPKLLLCDEPTGNLDSKTGEGIIALIRQAGRENRMAVVIVTHNAELAAGAQKVYHLKDGTLVNS
jgi:lipoprotein-releasing system ATP-binding protein